MKKRAFPFLLFFTISLYAIQVEAQETIAGFVLDAGDRTPLIGVSVHVEQDETIGTASDLDGGFTLTVPSDSTRLVVSYTGYRSQLLAAGTFQNGPVLLEPSASLLDEVVVIGYGTQRRRVVTGSISSVDVEDAHNAPVVSLESALQGLAPGILVSNESGKVGFNVDVNIRGIASINATQQPLYIVDGQVLSPSESVLGIQNRLNPLATLNVDDIASIDILKDASAAAIYGARASNGVILITTRKGAAHETRIEVDISSGWSKPTIKREWLNASQYLELWDEAFHNVADESGTVFGSSAEQWKDQFLSGWRDGHDTNWEDLIYDPRAGQKSARINLSGGDDRTTFFISGSYSDHNAIIILNDYKRYSGRLNLTHKVSDRLDIGVKMSLSRSDLTEVPYDWDFASPASLRSQSPVQPLYDPDNPDEIFPGTFYFHARSYLGNVDWTAIDLRTLANASVNWKPHKNVTLHSDVGFDLLTHDLERWYSSKVERNTREGGGWKRKWNNETSNYSSNTYLQFDKSIDQHQVRGTAGMSYQESQGSFARIFGRNFPNDDFQNLANAGETYNATEWEASYSVLSYFGRLHYQWQQKYLVNMALRVDGDSRFGRDHRYGWFPAVSTGWVLSQEPFLQEQRLITYLKLRASWGVTGNAPIQHFPSLGLFEGGRYGSDPGIIQTQIPNSNLKWEETTQVNFGLDFGLLEDRLSGSVDYYVKNTRDLLLEVNIPATTGFSRQLQNLGKLKNRGLEISLHSHNLSGRFKWETHLNWATNMNEVTDLQGQILEHDLDGIINRVVEGQPMGVFFAPEFAGVDPANGDALYFRNKIGPDGEMDRSTTNDIAEAREVMIGDPNPDFIYGITNRFRWKNFHLSAMFQGVHGNQIYNAAGRFQMDGFGWFDNQDLIMLNRWQQPGDITDIPQLRFLQGSLGSSRFVSTGSYLRLKNVRLAYHLQSGLAKKLGFEQIELYSVGQNLITWTKYAFGDPEVQTDVADLSDRRAISRGISFFTPPQAKTFLFGVRAKF